MNRKKLFLTTGTALGLAALALAHHVPVALSYVSGSEILSEVVFFTGSGTFGVPAYKVGNAEAPGHHDPVGVADGDAFSVLVQSGASETVTFSASDFPDIAKAVVEDVLGVINAKASLFEAIEQNGYVAFRGLDGGSVASVKVADGAGTPLSKLGMVAGAAFGSDDLELTLSIPDPTLNLAGRTYLILASTTAGSFTINNRTIPIGYDAITARIFDATLAGNVPGFVGTLDGNSDASAHMTGAQLQQGFAGNFPDEMYFSFVVLSADQRRISYVSNPFVVDFR